MKDITHYFQVPNKNVSNVPEIPKAENLPAKKTKNTTEKSTPKNKKKVKLSQNSLEVSETVANTDENEPNEKPSSGKKRKDSRGRPSKNKKPKLDDTSINIENQANEKNPVQEKKSLDRSSDSLFDDRSFLDDKELKTYSKKKPYVRLNESIVNENGENTDKHNDRKKIIENCSRMRVVLEDCMKTNSKINSNGRINGTSEVSNGSVKLEDSDSDSCFISAKKSNQKGKSKSSEKSEEESSSGNSLLKYFNKVDKSKINDEKSLAQAIITVQAIVHSPPKDKSHLIKKHCDSSESFDIVNSKKKKKVCNFDDIKVVDTEIIENEPTTKPKSSGEPQPSETSSKNSILKVKPWKMRVKLTPSSKLNDIVANGKSSKYKKIIHSSDSEEEPKNDSPEKAISDDDVEIISVTKSTPVLPEKKQPLKLAPLFCKKYEATKNVNNRIRISEEAKQLFLKSGVPETLKKKMEEQKNFTEEKYNGEYVFPKFSHIQQKDLDLFVWNLKECTQFKWKSVEETVNNEDTTSLSCLLDRKLEKYELRECKEREKFHIEKEISLLKKQEPSVNITDISNSIKKLYELNNNSDNLCWTEKYNPISFEDMIGNTGSLRKLKEWIESHKRLKQIFIDSDNSSGDEFYDSDDSCNSADTKNNIAILVGPPGCGKTCAVYMLANELGFKVLEVNASSNRTGKKIIDELLEATQSHRVKRISGPENNKIEPKKTKRKKKDNVEKKEKKTMSLILIEDADILFEDHDEGFLSALNSLTSLTKRPLIFAVNNLNYPHLHKYNNTRNLVLKFDYPSRSLINVWLRLIALTEGVKLTDEVLMELYKIAGSDLRKNLMQLQLLISSKLHSPRCSNELLFYQDWLSHVTLNNDKKSLVKMNDSMPSNSCNTLFSDEDDRPFVPPEKKSSGEITKKRNALERQEDLDALLKTAKFLNFAANLDNFNIENNYRIFPAEILHQFDRHEDYNIRRLNGDIMQFFKDTLFSEFQESTSISFKKYHKAIEQYTKIMATSEKVFESFNPRIGNHVARNCEYLPVIRDIARSECNKLNTSFKRSSRFFGYLKSANIEITDREKNILCNTFVL